MEYEKQLELEQTIVLLKRKAIEGYSVGYDRAMTKYGICENDREERSKKDWIAEVKEI